MDFGTIVKEVGFPAAAFAALFWLVRTTLKDNSDAIRQLQVAIAELRGWMARVVGNGKED